MLKEEFLLKIKSHFPDFEIKSKDESLLMQIVGKIMFFNKDFMTNFTTTVGNTIYFPSKNYLSTHPVSGLIVLLHELVHIYDYKKYTPFLFTLLYSSPQIFALLALPLLLISWKLSLLCLLFLLPLPSFFRANFEKRAYLASLYAMKKLNDRYDYKIDLRDQKSNFVSHFKNSTYYFMWPFSLEKEFDEALAKIESGSRPYEDKIFDILDEILNAS